MKIGQLSKATGTGVETIRHYERIGLLPSPDRTSGNFRHYGAEHLECLTFIREARDLGFSFDSIRTLLSVQERLADGDDNARAILGDHLEVVERKLNHLLRLQAALRSLEDRSNYRKADPRSIIRALMDGAAQNRPGDAKAPF